jgi:hypothetical protein
VYLRIAMPHFDAADASRLFEFGGLCHGRSPYCPLFAAGPG